jgi:LysM repeat protein
MKKIWSLIGFACIALVLDVQASSFIPTDSIGAAKVNGKIHVKYLVEPGETVYGISSKYKVPVSELLEINPELEHGLKVGQVINIPYNAELVQATKKEQKVEEVEVYKVQPGDTYYGIAKRYGVTVEELMKMNNIDLKVGQEIVVSKKPVTSTIATTASTTPEVKVEKKEEVKPVVTETKVEPVPVTPKPEVKPTTTTTTKVEEQTPAPATTTKKTYVSRKEKENPFAGVVEPYAFNPNRKQVLVIPFDPYLYFSDADDEIAARSNMPRNKVREVFRRRLNALLNAEGYETIKLVGGKSKDSLTDLNKIYSSVTYNYQSTVINPSSRNAAPKGPEPTKSKGLKDKLSKNADSKYELPEETSKYFGVIIKNQDFYNYFNAKYDVDYYIFVNQFEVKTNYENCLDRAALNYERTFTTHFSIFDNTGKQVAGNSFKTHYNSNSNYVYQIVSDNIPQIAERILNELPLPNE